MSVAAHRLGLRAKLLVLLLAFGAIPLVTVMAVGYAVSRATITKQAANALEALAAAQAVHLATELSRERLLLRTIAGQLPPVPTLEATSAVTLSRVLVQSLPEGGVFDGLRIVTPDGRVLANVALGTTAPHWPPAAPASDWTRERVTVHRDGSRVLAYLIAVPATERSVTAWLEGHVREEDFQRAFAMPQHLMSGVESVVVEGNGMPVFGTHEHAVPDLVALMRGVGGNVGGTIQVGRGSARALLATAPVAATDWVFAAVLPLHVALAPLSRLRNTAVAGAGALVLLIVATAALAARSVTTPLRELAAAARRLGREGRYQPIPAHTADEVGALVQSFDTMARDLQDSRAEIEKLHARDLERAQQLATVGELASGVAHEIRNPLTGVRGALELALQKLPADESSRPLLEEAQRQLKRIEDTTTQLLRYARPPALRDVTIDVNLLTERAAHVVESQAAAAGVSLRTEPAPTPVLARADPELMVQVLVNLMLNGIEAMAPGGELTVWIARHAPEAWIGVRDTGPGIPPAARGEIFRPFYTTKHQGTGLGLSISQQIVTRHGGTLRVEDTPGGGATFVAALPLVEPNGGNGEPIS